MLSLFRNARCVLCLAATGRSLDLCIDCERELPFIRRCCFRCGVPLPHLLCGRCLTHPPPFKRCYAPLRYCDPVDRLVMNFKESGHRAIGRVIASLVAERYADLTPACLRPTLLVPVPLTRARLKARGFNQSVDIARILETAIPGARVSQLCTRVRETASQKSLGAADRERNLRGAFACKGQFNGEHVAVVDDVVTTSSTVSELARILIAAGAGDVEVIALARTAPASD